jgi:hypothetical protein
MPSESLNDTPPPHAVVGPAEKTEDVEGTNAAVAGAELPVELSEFSQRLASFGLGEAPDPLLTESRPPSKRRPRR